MSVFVNLLRSIRRPQHYHRSETIDLETGVRAFFGHYWPRALASTNQLREQLLCDHFAEGGASSVLFYVISFAPTWLFNVRISSPKYPLYSPSVFLFCAYQFIREHPQYFGELANVRNSRGQSLLFVPSEFPRELIAAGVDPYHRDNRNRTAFDYLDSWQTVLRADRLHCALPEKDYVRLITPDVVRRTHSMCNAQEIAARIPRERWQEYIKAFIDGCVRSGRTGLDSSFATGTFDDKLTAEQRIDCETIHKMMSNALQEPVQWRSPGVKAMEPMIHTLYRFCSFSHVLDAFRHIQRYDSPQAASTWALQANSQGVTIPFTFCLEPPATQK